MKKQFVSACLICMLYPLSGYAEKQTTTPVLTISPDARSSGMGEAGVSNEPDVYSQYWNPAKYPFSGYTSGIGISYTPWLQKWAKDMALFYLAGYQLWGDRQEQGLAASIRYFSLGEINNMWDESGATIPPLHPYEMAIDVSYSRKLSSTFSLGVGIRYIRSDMGIKINEDKLVANAFSIDLAGYGERYFVWDRNECLWSGGFHITNIGNRISYDQGTSYDFLPALLKLGTGILYPVSKNNQAGFYFDIHKYLVPSLPVTGEMSSLKGVFRSFSDAPGGWREELKELIFSLGVEYKHNERFFLRMGYHHENKKKGDRQYLTVGSGIYFRPLQIDLSYLVSTSQNNPLDQTIRISLSLNLEEIKYMLY